MPFNFACPHCGCKSAVDDHYAGHSGPCRGCGQTVTIPFGGPNQKPSHGGGSSILTILVISGVLGVLACAGVGALAMFGARAARSAAEAEQAMAQNRAIQSAAAPAYIPRPAVPPEVAKLIHVSPAPERFTREHLVPGDGPLESQIQAHAAKAREQGRALFVEIGDEIPICDDIDNSLSDPRMIEAYAGTYVLHLDKHEWGGTADQLGIPTHFVPAWYEVDVDSGGPTGRTINGGAWGENVPGNMAQLLRSFFATNDRAPVRGDEKHLLFHERDVTCIAFSGTGKWLVSGSQDATIKLWDTETGQLRKTLAGGAAARSVSASCNGQQVAAGYVGTGQVGVWDTLSGSLQGVHDFGQPLAQVAFGPGPDELVLLPENGPWVVRNLRDGGAFSPAIYPPTTPETASGGAMSLGPSMASSQDARTWVVHQDRKLQAVFLEPGFVGAGESAALQPAAVAISADGQVVACQLESTVELFRLQPPAGPGGKTMILLRTIEVATERRCLALSNNGRLLAVAGPGNSIVLWDVERGARVGTRTGHFAAIVQLVFAGDDTLASASEDNTVRLWDVSGLAAPAEAPPEPGRHEQH